MSGYQEVFTDPSYRGQIVVMTAPMIGNYGVNTDDPESAQPQVAGVVVRELSRTLLELARRRRSPDAGSRRRKSRLSKALIRAASRDICRTRRRDARRDRARATSRRAKRSPRSTPVRRWKGSISRRASRRRSGTRGAIRSAPYHIVAYDFGIKRNILRLFAEHGCRVTVVPAETPAEEALGARAGRCVSLERAG